jgi:hypothetical protein
VRDHPTRVNGLTRRAVRAEPIDKGFSDRERRAREKEPDEFLEVQLRDIHGLRVTTARFFGSTMLSE